MTQFPHITFTVVAGPFDWPLMLCVLGTSALALAVNCGALVGWLRKRQ